MEVKCAVFHGVKDLRIERKALRALEPNECLIRVEVCGICGSDIHAYLGKTSYVTRPIVMGHEFSGRIEAVGSAISRFKTGHRVTVDPNIECGTCRYCREGNVRLCQDGYAYGVSRNGAFAEYMIAREDHIFAIPDDLSYEEAAFAEPASNAVHGVDLAQIRPGQAVVVVGGGPAGLQFVQLAKAVGADPLVLVTRARWKKDLAMKLGADHVFSPSEVDVRAEVMKLTGGYGAHAVIEAVGGAATIEMSYSLIKIGGRVVVYGVPPETDKFSIPALDFITRGKQILSSCLNPFCFERTIDVLTKKLVDVRPLVTHQFALDDINAAFEMMIRKPEGFIKALVIPRK